MLQGSVWGLVRGDDSTGLFQVNKGWNIRQHKLDVDGYHFARNKRAQDFFKDADTSLATIMHHRAATHGTISQENAHPFEHDTDDGMIIGVHNGTLNTWMRKEDNVNFEVDSDWLYYKIAKHGAADAMANHLHGAYALVWASTPDNRLHIAANGGRPIHWAYVDGKNTMLIASEAQMLYALASRNGLQIERPVYPEKGQIYTFDPRGDLRQYDVEAVPEPKRQTPVVAAREPLRPGRTPRVVDENARVVVEDLYSPSALAKSEFKHMEKVEFFFSRAEVARESVGTTGQQRWDLCGELIIEINNEASVIKDAVIRSMSQTVMENVRDADRVLCNVIGMRNIIDKATGLCQSKILLSPPDVTFFTKEERERKAPATEPAPLLADMDDLDDIPWGDKGVKGPRGKNIPVVEFLSLVKDGCSNCSGDISLADAPNLGWHTSGAGAYPICATCCRDPALMGNV